LDRFVMQTANTERFVFPKLANYLLPLIVVSVVGGAFYVPVLLGYGAGPTTTDVGYMPVQPVPYSHALHAGQLGIDCRYCHTTVDKAGFAAIPPTQTCMNCHTSVKPDSPLLKPVRESWATGRPIEWVTVHDLPDYAYFNHSAHVNKGVSCVSCHGRVDQMEVVWQDQPLSMGWCLDCHRAPEKNIRPTDQVTNLGWKPGDLALAAPGTESRKILDAMTAEHGGSAPELSQETVGAFLKKHYGIKDRHFMEACSTCHR
jgi:hypothetical protein